MKTSLVSVAALCLLVQVDAHGRLVKPASREQLTGSLLPHQQREPVELNSSKFVCRDQPAATPIITAAVGSAVTVQWDFTAAHVGDCAMYMSYDVGKPDKEQEYFKLANIADCKAFNKKDVNVQIPTYLPAGPAILRFEWYALHVRPTIEYYAQCVDITITSTQAGNLPPNLFKIGPHLPSAGTSYRSAYDGETYLVGPEPVSTIELGPTLPPVDETREPTIPGQTREPSFACERDAADGQTAIIGAAVSGWAIAVCALVSLVIVIRKQRADAVAAAGGTAYAFEKNIDTGYDQNKPMQYAGNLGNPRFTGDDL